MVKFCANLSFMFTESPFLERYALAKSCGFKAVETGFPYGFSINDVVSAKQQADVQQTLINIHTGDVTKGELGHAAIPGKEVEFKESLELTIDYAKALNVSKIHIMAGKLLDDATDSNHSIYESNLKESIKILQKENIIGLIEPINNYSVPNYYMNSYDKAVQLISKFNSPHLRLMLDVFHLQQIKGDITHAINDYLPYVGHVQIAQVPNRNEPDSPGEIDYRYVLQYLEKKEYTDWIGLEYKPAETSQKGLKWIEKFGFQI